MSNEIIEINGVKFEVDLTTAKKITEFKIGDNVKVLKKEYQDYKSYFGVIIGFDYFNERPTINIAYLKLDYSNAGVEFLDYNKDSKEVEIAPIVNVEDFNFKKSNVIDIMDREIYKKEEEVKDLIRKKEYFLNNFNKHFTDK